jgi:hypothetical protein
VNQSLHPECVADITLKLRDLNQSQNKQHCVIRAVDGVVKLGYYADTSDPKKKRFTTLNVINLNVKEKK